MKPVGYLDENGSPYCVLCAYKTLGKITCRVCPHCGHSLAISRTVLTCTWHRCPSNDDGKPFRIDWRDQNEPYSNPDEIGMLDEEHAEGIVCSACRRELITP